MKRFILIILLGIMIVYLFPKNQSIENYISMHGKNYLYTISTIEVLQENILSESEKVVRFYNEYEQCIEATYFTFYGDWHFQKRVQYQYSNNNHDIASHEIHQLFYSEQWHPDQEIIRTFHDNFIQTEIHNKWYDSLQQWRTTYEYEKEIEENLITFETYNYYNFENGITYHDFDNREYYYNQENLLEEQIRTISWLDNQQYRSLYFYEDQLIVERIDQEKQNEDWVNTCKASKNYDDNDIMIDELHYLWQNENWYPDSRILYENETYTEIMIYDCWIDENWQHEGKEISVYDNQERKIEELTFEWDNSQWIHRNKQIWLYNSDRLMKIERQIFDTYWITEYRETIFYETTDMNNDFLKTESVTIFPNPCNPEAVIEFTLSQPEFVEINIFNVKGQKIKTLIKSNLPKGNNQYLWDGTNDKKKPVSNGLYFININLNKKWNKTKKVLLIK